MMRAKIVALLASAAVPLAQAAPDIVGDWWTPGFNARVRIERCGDAVCGRIVWLWDETPKDIADKQPLLGRVVIDRMQAADAGRWQGGRLYNPEDGRDYKGSLQLQSPTRLVVDGCVLFICRTQVWRRADAQQCPPVALP
jgi:uncharacterized protein (DUF2147 family)